MNDGLENMWQNGCGKKIFGNNGCKSKGRLNSGNASYHSVHNLLSSHLLSKNLKIKIYKNNNFTCCFVCVRNLVSHTKGRTQLEGVWEQGAEENIWT